MHHGRKIRKDGDFRNHKGTYQLLEPRRGERLLNFRKYAAAANITITTAVARYSALELLPDWIS